MHAQNVSRLITQIEQGKTRFLKSLPQRVGSIVQAVSRLHESVSARNDVRGLFHALSGTAGTYGLSAVAALCSEAEELCDLPSFGTDEEAYLKVLLRDLRASADHAAARADARDEKPNGKETRQLEWPASF